MRIDKFLWSVRFFKTRSKAVEQIKKNRVSIDNQLVKPSREVRVDDVIGIRKNQIDYKIKVLKIPKSRMGAKLVPLHIKDVTDKEQYEILKMRKMQQNYYRIKGEGRPTKKDRREIDGFLTSDYSGKEQEDTDWDDFFRPLDEDERLDFDD